MCERVCRKWRGICSHAKTCDTLWRGMWLARRWRTCWTGHGRREEATRRVGCPDATIPTAGGRRLTQKAADAGASEQLQEQDGPGRWRPGRWKELFKARHCDEVDLNLEANIIVVESMEQMARLKCALQQQRLDQEAKLQQRLILRRALRRSRLTQQERQQERQIPCVPAAE